MPFASANPNMGRFTRQGGAPTPPGRERVEPGAAEPAETAAGSQSPAMAGARADAAPAGPDAPMSPRPVPTPASAPPAGPRTVQQRAVARSWKEEEDQRALLRRIRELVTEAARERGIGDDDAEGMRALARQIAEAELRAAGTNAVQFQAMMREIMSYIGTGLGPLQPLFEDPATEEVMVNRHDEVWVYRAGRHERRPEVRFRDDDEVVALVQRLVGQIGRQFNFANPIVDGRLPDGSRLNAILSGAVADRGGGVSARGTAVTIRRVVARPDFGALLAQGAIPTPEAAGYLERAIAAKRNLLVIGGMAARRRTSTPSSGGCRDTSASPSPRTCWNSTTRCPTPCAWRCGGRTPRAAAGWAWPT